MRIFKGMSFLRHEKQKSGNYLSICESYRDDKGTPKQKILYRLGKVEDYSAETLRRIGSRLYTLGGGKLEDLLKQDEAKEVGRYNYGFPMVCKQLLACYQMHTLLVRLARKHNLAFDLYRAVLLMLCDRLNDPLSKLGSHTLQDEYVGIDHVELHHLYRALDKLCEHSALIQRHIYEQNKTLFNYELDVVFYDVTTFYFDSEVEQPGALRQMGFSKDGKIGKTQVVFALLVDSNKNPLGYRVYSGNYFEGHTFKDIVAQLRQEYCIKQVVIVADRGMMSKANLQLFEDEQLGAGYQFIVGERLKNLAEHAKAYLTDLKNYTTVYWKNDDGNEITLRYCTYQYNTKTLIGSYSQSRADKDKFDRQQRIAKAEHLLKQPSQLQKKAARYFLKRTDEAVYELDKEKIAQAERYDGFVVIATNATALSPEQVLEKYKDLYRIEQTFRTFKSYLETRPMFHWTDQRICGHLCMCYISFCLLNYLQQRLRAQNIVSSEQTIRRMLVKMQLSKLEQNGNTIYLRSSLDEQTKAMLKAIGLRPPPDMFAEDRIAQYV